MGYAARCTPRSLTSAATGHARYHIPCTAGLSRMVAGTLLRPEERIDQEHRAQRGRHTVQPGPAPDEYKPAGCAIHLHAARQHRAEELTHSAAHKVGLLTGVPGNLHDRTRYSLACRVFLQHTS